MRRYRVAFDGRWQARFSSEAEAMAHAESIARSGKIAYVVERRLLRKHLVAVFPPNLVEDEAKPQSDAHAQPSVNGQPPRAD